MRELLKNCSLIAVTAFALHLPASAQDSSADRIAELEAQILELQKEKAQADAEKSLIEAEKSLLDARITALGLPSFENTNTLAQGGGNMEAMLLGSAAIEEAAALIAADIGSNPIIIMSGSEASPWGDALTMEALLDLRRSQLEQAVADWNEDTTPRYSWLGTPETITAAVTAAAKLFGQETSVAPLAFETTDLLLMRAVAAKAQGKVYRPDTLLAVTKDNRLIAAFDKLRTILLEAEDLKRADPINENKSDDWAALQAAIGSANSLVNQLTTAADGKSPPLFVSARHAELLSGDRKIATIHLDYSGGSAVTRKNLWTFFGADPLRVSGGLIASYTLSDPATGQVSVSGVVACRTTFTSLRRVQGENWGRPPANSEKPLCRTIQ